MLDENTKNLPSENKPVEEDKKDQSKEVKDSAEEIKKEDVAIDQAEEETAETDKITEEPVKTVEVSEKVHDEEETPEAKEQKSDPEEETAKSQEETGDKVETEEVAEESDEGATKKSVEESVKVDVPRIQFTKLSLDDLTKMLDDFLRDYDIQDIKQQIEELKTVFTKKFKDFLKEKREEHVKSGGEEAGFFRQFFPLLGKSFSPVPVFIDKCDRLDLGAEFLLHVFQKRELVTGPPAVFGGDAKYGFKPLLGDLVRHRDRYDKRNPVALGHSRGGVGHR